MNSKSEISIIIPAHNEEKRIQKCLKRTIEYCTQKQYNFEIIVTEDGSTDNTIDVIKDFQQKCDKIKLISFKERLGKGGAIAQAMFTATKKNVGFMDADLATDPSEFEKLLDEIVNNDVVIGSRIIRGTLPPIKRPFYRTVFSHLYSKFFRMLFRIQIFDPQCGFKLFRREVIPKLFNEVHTTGFAFDSEIIVRACSSDLKIKEIPINWDHQAASKIRVITQIKEMGSDLLSIWYEFHLLWLQNKKVYPQKRASLKGRILFRFLSLYKKSKGRN